jgi:hypothetical protein
MQQLTRTILVAVVFSLPAFAQDWAFVRSTNSESISAADTIVATLGTATLKTQGTLLTQVDQVGLVIQASISGTRVNGDGQTVPETVAFPLAYQVPNPDRHKPRAVLPFEQTFIMGLPLTQSSGKVQYKNLTVKLDLVNVSGPSTLAKVATKLLSAVSAASIPASPFAIGVKYIADFANGYIKDSIDSAAASDKSPLGSRSLNFRTAPIPTTGIYLLMQPAEQALGGGWVNPNDLSNNCLYLQQTGGGRTIMVGWTTGAGAMDADGCYSGSYTKLLNAYVPILLQTELRTGSLGSHIDIYASDPVINTAREKKLAQCADFGITAAKCRAANPTE